MTYASLAVALVAGMFIAPAFRTYGSLFLLLVLAMAVVPKVLTTQAHHTYVGIAPDGLTTYTFSVLVLACLLGAVMVAGIHLAPALLPWIPLASVSAIEYAYFWPHDSLTTSGEANVLTAVACYVVGYLLVRGGLVSRAVVARTFFVVILSQCVAVAASLLGHSVHVAKGPQAADLAGRVIGTTGHPDQLAKLLLLSLAALMAYAPVHLREQRLHRVCIVAAVVLIALTKGRAAFAGAAIAIALSFLLEPNRVLKRKRLIVLVATSLIVAIAASAFIARSHADPSGGARPHLTSLAFHVIGSNFLHGVGPNHYVQVVGQLDPLTASGVPVHDAFLLTVGEMGIFAGALIWLPFALLLIRAIRSSRTAGAVGLTARAYLAIVPALLLTGVTGWGLLQAPTFELFALVAGLFAGQLSTEPEPEGVIEDTRAGVALA